MKIWTIIIVMLSVNISNGQNIEKIRRLYLQSSNNYSKLDSLNYSLSNYKKTNNLMSAYYGVNLILKSKYLKNPFKKIEYFVFNKKAINQDFIKLKKKYKFENFNVLESFDEMSQNKYDFIFLSKKNSVSLPKIKVTKPSLRKK